MWYEAPNGGGVGRRAPVLAAAVSLGDLPLVQWLQQRGAGQGLQQGDWGELLTVVVARGGSEALLEWLWQRCPGFGSVPALVVAVRDGDRGAAEWLAAMWAEAGRWGGEWRG